MIWQIVPDGEYFFLSSETVSVGDFVQAERSEKVTRIVQVHPHGIIGQRDGREWQLSPRPKYRKMRLAEIEPEFTPMLAREMLYKAAHYLILDDKEMRRAHANACIQMADVLK